MWFQHQVAPDLDTRRLFAWKRSTTVFRLVLEDGDTFIAQRVVMATGLLGHEYRPAQFDGLPRALVSHSCEHTDAERYRGKRVAVIGRGQSACESAALLHEPAPTSRSSAAAIWSGMPIPASAARCARRCAACSAICYPRPRSAVSPTTGQRGAGHHPALFAADARPLERTESARDRDPMAASSLQHVPVDQGRTILARARMAKAFR